MIKNYFKSKFFRKDEKFVEIKEEPIVPEITIISKENINFEKLRYLKESSEEFLSAFNEYIHVHIIDDNKFFIYEKIENGFIKIYYEDDLLIDQTYFNKLGQIHRNENEGPAYIKHNMLGFQIIHYYFLNGKYHRNNGPAKIEYSGLNNKLEITNQENWINGKKI